MHRQSCKIKEYIVRRDGVGIQGTLAAVKVVVEEVEEMEGESGGRREAAGLLEC